MYQLILCTCPDENTAKIIASALVKERLAACVNIIANVQSVYEWQGKIEYGTEWQLVIKSRLSLFSLIEQSIIRLHPYEIPEIISLPISQGSAAYLDWIGTQTSEGSK